MNDGSRKLGAIWNEGRWMNPISRHNLAEFGGDLQSLLFRAYGMAEPEARKIQFHLCLDEFF